jgi:hypothetical protein
VRTVIVDHRPLPAPAGRDGEGRRRPLPLVLIVAALSLLSLLFLTGASSPDPSATTAPQSGTEGTKAALVRIELSVVAEIVHIDHSSGEVELARGKSTVPLGSGTGVLVSADGIVATTWENLAVDPERVAVYAANELFATVIGVPIVGNGGDPARRGETPDPYWAPHLHHCYDQVTHCVHFRVPQYHVRTYTSKPGGVMAELLNSPSTSDEVALLRISGGGGAPTATVASPDAAPGTNALLLGFTERPGPDHGPAEVPVTLDAQAGRLGSPADLAESLDAGVSGGPVVDPATGDVVGLAGSLGEDGLATLVSAEAIRAAMEEAGVEPSSSKFDVVFRRGIDHLSSGDPGTSAQSALEESLTYYDSALAASHLQQARAMASAQPDDGADPAAAAGPEQGAGGLRPAVVLPILIAVLLVAGVIAALVLRRRRTPAAAGAASRPPDGGPGGAREGRAPAAPVLTVAPGHPKGPARHSATTGGSVRPAPGAGPPAAGGPGRAGGASGPAGPAAPGAGDGAGQRFCSQCGQAVGQGARFCSGCGHPVG